MQWTQEDRKALRALLDRLAEMEEQRATQQPKWSIDQWDTLLDQIEQSQQKATK